MEYKWLHSVRNKASRCEKQRCRWRTANTRIRLCFRLENFYWWHLWTVHIMRHTEQWTFAVSWSLAQRTFYTPPYLRVCCSCVCVGASGFPQVHFMLNDDVNTKTMQLAGEQSTEDRKKRTEIVSICLEILWIFGLVCHSAVFYWNSYEECTSETISTNVERYESMQIYFCWWVLVLMVQSHNFVENLYAHQLLVYRCQRYFIGSFGIQLDFMLSRKL